MMICALGEPAPIYNLHLVLLKWFRSIFDKIFDLKIDGFLLKFGKNLFIFFLLRKITLRGNNEPAKIPKIDSSLNIGKLYVGGTDDI